jgi:hypothetical protein
MKAAEIIKDMVANSHPKITYKVLASKLGYKGGSSVTDRLNRGELSAEKFAQFADELGYEIIVRPKTVEKDKEDFYRLEYPKRAKEGESE